MKIIYVYGGTLYSSRVKRIGGIEEHIINLNDKLNSNFDIVYAGYPKDLKFQSVINKNSNSLIVLSDISYFSFLIKYVKYIIEQKKRHKKVIVHVHFGPISHMIILVTRLLGISSIYWTKHSRLVINKYSKSWFIQKFSGFFVKKIICVSKAVEKELKELHLDYNKTITIPLGLNIDKYNTTITKEMKKELYLDLDLNLNDFIITIVAQQRPEKRVEVFIKAFAAFIKTNNLNDVVGLIVGGGPLEESNIVLAKELGVYEKLRFTGLRHDINVIYSISDIAGLTSETEGLPFALMEATAMSLPLFGSDAGGIPEVIVDGYNGYLFKIGDYKDLSAKFYKYYVNKDIREKFGDNSLVYLSEHYDIDICTQMLISEYENNV